MLSHPAGPATPSAPPTWARGLSPRPGRCLSPGGPSWQGSGIFRGKPSFPELAGSGTHTSQWGRPFIGVWCGPGHFSWAGCGHPLVTSRCVQKGSHWPKVQNKSSLRSLLMAAVSLWDEPTSAFQAAKTQPSPHASPGLSWELPVGTVLAGAGPALRTFNGTHGSAGWTAWSRCLRPQCILRVVTDRRPHPAGRTG